MNKKQNGVGTATGTSQYEQMGVDPGKDAVRSAFKDLIDNEFLGAWVNMIIDPSNPNRVITQHSDGNGSKGIQNWLHYLETGEASVLGYMADDAWAMNGADIAAAGFVFGPWFITDVINSSLPEVPKNLLMQKISERLMHLKGLYAANGFLGADFKSNRPYILGGETADLPDQVLSVVFDMTITAFAEKSDIITGNIKPGDKIWGFASDGQAAWEEKPNSGLMSNGLTMARTCLMSVEYNGKYPYLHGKNPYRGRYLVNDQPEILGGMTVSEALISPTRQWPIVIRKIMERLKKGHCLDRLHGISINTGGGATKIKHLGQGGITYTKEMPSPAPIFQLIQAESKEEWQHMYKSFNCGIGIDIVGEHDQFLEETLKVVAEECNLPLFTLGECRKFDGENNQVILDTPFGEFVY